MSWGLHNKRSHGIDFAYQQELRAKVIVFLGGKCQRCGFDDIRALQIDHINGLPYKERLKSIYLYLDILENPKSKEIYQLLCANCNWIKRAENKEDRGGYAKKRKKTKPKHHLG